MAKSPSKPTTPFGWLAFGKDGTVKPEFQRLGDNKTDQEAEVLKLFLQRINRDHVPDAANFEKLGENDNDALVYDSNNNPLALVEITELVLFDFCEKISAEDYNNGKFNLVTVEPGKTPDNAGNFLKVDLEKLETCLVNKIRKKLRYRKPENNGFWLIIFNVAPFPLAVGKSFEIDPIANAINFCIAERGSIPFTKIFYFDMRGRPELIFLT